MKRSAGILLPISSLPSPYGIGCFSQEAYDFVDWLKEAGQTYWQILPLGVTSYGDSPYQSFSAFAGNPYFISLDELIEEGVLARAECEKVNWGKAKGSIDYEKIYNGRYPLLRKAYERSKVSENPEYQKFVKEKGLDVGFAYDGDADRCLAVDENGNVVDGDLILYICGKYMKEQGLLRNNKIVTTVMSNLGLYKALDREGIGYEKTAVGDKYVYENMSRTGNCLGGEQSGHIIFSKYATTGDGILTSLKIMEVMLEKKETLGKLASEVTILPQLLKNVRVADKAAALNDPDVQAAGKAVDEALGNDGRLLLRQSGTEPLIRVMVEAETPEICEKYVDQVIDVLKKKGHVTEG